MDKTTMAALLARPLTPSENTNFEEYLEIATELLTDVLCYNPFGSDGSGVTAETRYFEAREGYSTVFVGAFTDATDVKVNGRAVTDYQPRLWDDRNSSWYNSLVFSCPFTKSQEIEVTAEWGFTELPADLARLLSKYFALVSGGVSSDVSIQSKQVEDYRITYGNVDQTKAEQIANANASTISKYSICSIGNVRHGGICR